MIMDVLGNESYPVVELARRLDVDWTIVLAVLEDLVARGGVVDEIAAPGGERTEYRVAGVVDQSVEGAALVVPASEAVSIDGDPS